MDETLRNELTTIVLERADREHLVIHSGDLEAAVVRIYRKAETTIFPASADIPC